MHSPIYLAMPPPWLKPSTRPPTQASKDPDAMELNPKTWGYAPKNSAEWQKRVKEDRYFKYSSKDHLSLNYSALILHTELVEINLIKIDFCLFSLGEVSLNKLS